MQSLSSLPLGLWVLLTSRISLQLLSLVTPRKGSRERSMSVLEMHGNASGFSHGMNFIAPSSEKVVFRQRLS